MAGIRLVGLAIDCADAPPVARFYERPFGFRIGGMGPRCAQLSDSEGGVHLNIQGATWHRPPIWPESEGELTKMMHFEVEVEDLEAAVATAIEAGGTQVPWQPPDRDLSPPGGALRSSVHRTF